MVNVLLHSFPTIPIQLFKPSSRLQGWSVSLIDSMKPRVKRIREYAGICRWNMLKQVWKVLGYAGITQSYLKLDRKREHDNISISLLPSDRRCFTICILAISVTMFTAWGESE